MKLRISCIVVLVIALLGANAYADTMTVSGTFSQVFASNGYDTTGDPSGSGVTLNTQSITGLAQFDTTLGTLTDVQISVTLDWSYSLQLYAGNIIDGEEDHSVTMDVPDLSIYLSYASSGTATTVEIGTVDLAPTATASGSGYVPSNTTASDSGSSVVTLLSLMSLADFTESDFSGTGDISTLSAIIAIPNGADYTLVNLDDAFSLMDVILDAATVTVVYTYTPIPEPMAASLLVLGFVLLLFFRRRHTQYVVA